MRNRFSDGYYSAQAPPGVYDCRFAVEPPACRTDARPTHPLSHRRGRSSTNEPRKQVCDVKHAPRPEHVLRFTMTSNGASTSESTRRRKELDPTAVTVAEEPSGSVATQQLERQKQAVHWDLTADYGTQQPLRSILKKRCWDPLYKQMLLTPPFTLHVTFDNVKLAIGYIPTRLRANCLLDFEVKLSRTFPETCRMRMGEALQKGYCLVLFSRGFRKRVPVRIRGPLSVHADAAFTGFLNTVRANGTVLLEWE
jgi:hypothetical protein